MGGTTAEKHPNDPEPLYLRCIQALDSRERLGDIRGSAASLVSLAISPDPSQKWILYVIYIVNSIAVAFNQAYIYGLFDEAWVYIYTYQYLNSTNSLTSLFSTSNK